MEIKNGEVMPVMPKIDDVCGHEGLRRAIEVALVGSHPMFISHFDGSVAPFIVNEVAKVAGLPFHALVIAPCPCGNYGSARLECSCSPESINKYLSEINKRRNEFDIFIESVGPRGKLGLPEPLTTMINRVVHARNNPCPKGYVGCDDLLNMFQKEMKADAIDLAKVKAVANTIAKLDGNSEVLVHHISEAIQYSRCCCSLLRQIGSYEAVEVKV